MEKKFKETKAAAFFKKNIYYIVIVACVLAIGVMITVSAVADKRNKNNPTSADVQNVTPVDDGEKTGQKDGEQSGDTTQSGEQTTDPADNEPTPQPVSEKVLFSMPGVETEMYFDYAMDQLVFHQTLGCWAVHKGCDFVIGGDGAVLAVADGKVSSVSSNILDGVVISVEHADGYVSTYKSLADDPAVKVGDVVKRGDKLGYASDSAYNEVNDGAHLHLEIKQNGAYIDPMSVLPEALK